MTDKVSQNLTTDAWNPGLESRIPAFLFPLVTLYRAENATVSYAQAKELSDFCGLNVLDLIALRPERLVVHELLIRVTADLSVPDGPNYEVLGLNLRGMVATIYAQYVVPDMAQVTDAFDALRAAASESINQQLSDLIFDRQASALTETPKRSVWARILGHEVSPQKTSSPSEPAEIVALARWQQLLKSAELPLHKSCLEALIKVVGAIVGHRGKLIADQALIAELAANQVCNQYGSEQIGKVIEPIIKKAIASENYRVLPPQDKPVIMNVKGASAAGKSTIRPQQRQLAEELGIPWQDFALISPDYWRKYLLDYESLGVDFKYGAMLTGQELEIIDKKLDRYMADKAARGEISHLLIDRFRFDSFTLEEGRTSDSRLLSRFGDRIFMFFVVTPPAETVVRAWKRGLSTGRFKAVDDLLYHNVEAFTGMPSLFFSWITSADKRVHFEFLDNDVPEGELPRTAAYGWNNTMTILDVNVMINIDRYRKVNIDAKRPDEIFNTSDMNANSNVGFIQRCMTKIEDIKFADQQTALVYAHVRNGKLVWWDRDYIESRADDTDFAVTLNCLGFTGQVFAGVSESQQHTIEVEKEKSFTFGRWSEG